MVKKLILTLAYFYFVQQASAQCQPSYVLPDTASCQILDMQWYYIGDVDTLIAETAANYTYKFICVENSDTVTITHLVQCLEKWEDANCKVFCRIAGGVWQHYPVR